MSSLFDILKACPSAIPPHGRPSPFTPTTVPNLEQLQALMTQHADVLSKEDLDKKKVREFTFVDANTQPCTRTLTLTPPPVCVDGVARSVSEYIEYCLGTSVDLFFVRIRKQFPNKTLTILSDQAGGGIGFSLA
jgi:hypothetical protein